MKNKYHPIRDYGGPNVDGVPRIENLLPRFLGAEKNSYTTGVMKCICLQQYQDI